MKHRRQDNYEGIIPRLSTANISKCIISQSLRSLIKRAHSGTQAHIFWVQFPLNGSYFEFSISEWYRVFYWEKQDFVEYPREGNLGSVPAEQIDQASKLLS